MGLPSIEQCHAFMEAINRGRSALGLPVVDKLDYDACQPGSSVNCLSARHLFVTDEDVGGFVGLDEARVGVESAAALSEAGFELTDGDAVCIPLEIKTITDEFDQTVNPIVDTGGRGLLTGVDYAEAVARNLALRDRLVEAGLVVA